MSEAAELIKAQITKVEKDREVANMAKNRAERDVRDQQTLVDIYDASLRSLRADLAKIAPEGEETEPNPEGGS